MMPNYAETVARSRQLRWRVSNVVKVIHLNKALDVKILNRTLEEMRNLHPVIQFSNDQRSFNTGDLYFKRFQHTEVYHVEQRTADITWKEVASEEINEPISNNRMLRVTLIQRPGQSQGELVFCFDQMAGDQPSFDTFVQDLFKQYLEVTQKIRIEAEVEKAEKAKEEAREQKQRELDIAAAAAASKLAKEANIQATETPAAEPPPELKKLSTDDFIEILKFLDITPDKVDRVSSPDTTAEEKASVFIKPDLTPERENELAQLYAEYKDLLVHTNVNLADSNISVLQRHITTVSITRRTELYHSFRNLIFPFAQVNDKNEVLKQSIEQNLAIQKKLAEAVLENYKTKLRIEWKLKQYKEELMEEYLKSGKPTIETANLIRAGTAPSELDNWIPPKEWPSIALTIYSRITSRQQAADYGKWLEKFEDYIRAQAPGRDRVLGPYQSWLRTIDSRAHRLISSEAIFDRIESDVLNATQTNSNIKLSPEVILASALGLATKLTLGLNMTVELDHDFRELFEPPVPVSTMDLSAAPILHPIDTDLTTRFAQSQKVNLVHAAELLQLQIDAYRRHNYLLDALPLMTTEQKQVTKGVGVLMPSISLGKSTPKFSPDVARAFQITRSIGVATNKHPWLRVEFGTLPASNKLDYSISFPQIAPWSAEKVLRIVEVAKLLMKDVQPQTLEDVLATFDQADKPSEATKTE